MKLFYFGFTDTGLRHGADDLRSPDSGVGLVVMQQTLVAERGAGSFEQLRRFTATTRRIDWPTVGVACAVYAGYIALTWRYSR